MAAAMGLIVPTCNGEFLFGGGPQAIVRLRRPGAGRGRFLVWKWGFTHPAESPDIKIVRAGALRSPSRREAHGIRPSARRPYLLPG